MRLEIEGLEQLFDMLEGRESEHTMFVGQVNKQNEVEISITVLATTKFLGYGGEDIISVAENVGNTTIPVSAWKDSPQFKSVYEKQKMEYDVLIAKVSAKRKEWTDKLKKKGFGVYEGVWFE